MTEDDTSNDTEKEKRDVFKLKISIPCRAAVKKRDRYLCGSICRYNKHGQKHPVIQEKNQQGKAGHRRYCPDHIPVVFEEHKAEKKRNHDPAGDNHVDRKNCFEVRGQTVVKNPGDTQQGDDQAESQVFIWLRENICPDIKEQGEAYQTKYSHNRNVWLSMFKGIPGFSPEHILE